MKVSDLQFEKVPMPTLKALFKKQKIEDFNAFKPVCYNSEEGPYYFHAKEYYFSQNIERVWDAYTKLHPIKAWDSEIVTFLLLYSQTTETVTYRDGIFDRLTAGQIYFIDLKIIGNFSIPVLHEISKIDEEEKVIQSCYLNTGKSQGSQWIKLRARENGGTIVTHETRYKGTNIFRDRILYPYFHLLAIDQFHTNARKSLD